MRLIALALVALGCEASCILDQPAAAVNVASRANAPNLDVARDIDHEGARAYASGRYHDAIQYFREARRLGGPSLELWNEARCHERLDEYEYAAKVIDEYLEQQDLAPEDRAEAQRELAQIKARPSVVTVATAPPGAYVAVDGQGAGVSPVSFEVAAGAHTVLVRREGFQPQTHKLDARFGRAILVEIDLAKTAR
jgi:hypothetical protein